MFVRLGNRLTQNTCISEVIFKVCTSVLCFSLCRASFWEITSLVYNNSSDTRNIASHVMLSRFCSMTWQVWTETFLYFLRKVTVRNGSERRLVIKSPVCASVTLHERKQIAVRRCMNVNRWWCNIVWTQTGGGVTLHKLNTRDSGVFTGFSAVDWKTCLLRTTWCKFWKSPR